jgi:hypothetical protein
MLTVKEKTFLTLIEIDVNQVCKQNDPDYADQIKSYLFCDNCIDTITEDGYDITPIGTRKEAKYGASCDSCDNNWCN